MIPYWLLWSFFFLGVILSQRQAQPQVAGQAPDISARRVSIGMSVGLLLLTVMIGFRYQVGGDWLNYQEIFKRSAFRTFDQTLLQSDPGYALLNWASQQLGYEAELPFDGVSYPSNPSVPPARRLMEGTPGKIAIADYPISEGQLLH